MLSLVHLIYMAGDKCMRQNACCIYIMHSSLQRFGHLGYFYCFHFAVLCNSINSELNANEINLHTLYSPALVQLMFIPFNTIYPE